jgi:CHASE2 domain-containing sensor protein
MSRKHILKFATTFLALLFYSGIAAAEPSLTDPAKSIVIASIFGMIAILFLCYVLLKYGGEA